MSKVFTLFLLLFFFSCNKEEMAKNAVMNAMTTGYWKVASFTNGTADVTSDFDTYKFQFKENLTVDAIHNTMVEKTGNWTADPNSKNYSFFT